MSTTHSSETIPRWTAGLHRVGLYFEGFVEDAPAVLEEYYKETVTSFGVRDSSRKSHSHVEHKENEAANCQDGEKVQFVHVNTTKTL